MKQSYTKFFEAFWATSESYFLGPDTTFQGTSTMANENFDPAAFLHMTQDAPLVRRPPLAEGDYVGVITELTTRPWVSPKDATKSGIAVDYQAVLEVPAEEQQRLGLTEGTLKVKGGFMLDTVPGGKGLDMSPGKNGGMRRHREAVDLNKPGDKFSIAMLDGKVARFKVKHREYPEGSGEYFEDLAGIAKL